MSQFFLSKRNLILGFVFGSISPCLLGQVTPPPAYSNTAAINYVRTWDVLIPEVNSSNLTIATGIDKARITTQYLDGLGRPVQTIVKNGSMVTGSSPVDLVSANVYDNWGREQYHYLPFGANNAEGNNSINDCRFKLNPFQQQAQFSTGQYPGETYYYGQTIFESSPLNRTLQSFSAGNSWVGGPNGGRGVSQNYYINTLTDEVRIWNVTEAGSGELFGTYQSPGIYNAGELYKNVSEDENSKQVIEFKDKEGKVILKKVQLTASSDNGTGKNYTGWLCTYYIYDDFGLLRAVIQPSGVETVNSNWILNNSNGNWILNTSLLDEQVFRYEYDDNNRMITKKVPGAAPVQMVYDARDRLVMTQDGNLAAAGKWLVTIYDELNRPVQTGLVFNSDILGRTAAEHRTYASSSIAYPFSSTNLPASYELLTKTGYDNYESLPSGAPSASLDASVIAGNFFTTYNASPEYAQQQSQSLQTIGLPTWSQTKVLGTSTYLYAVNIYDEKGRVIQTKSTNISGGTDIATMQHDFSGKVLRTHLKHEKSGTNPDVYQVLTKNEYDLLGRIAAVKKRINKSTTNITADKTIVTNSYDALGQLKSKALGEDPLSTSTPKARLEILNYKYNIRGWIESMNGDYVDGNGSSRFGYKLAYDKEIYSSGSANYSAQYNGNISSSIWRSTGDGEIRRYDYGYDAVNRLTKADFTQFTGGSFNVNAGIDYSVGGSSLNNNKISYDANGNILEMWQKAWKLDGSDWVDQMSYNYFAGTNRLKNVIDGKQDKNTKLGDFRYSTAYETALGSTTKPSTSTDYDYDVNGNLVKDLNKDIKDGIRNGISYNYLNLPSVIKVEGKGSLEYVYDATGNKLKKIVHETGKPDKVTTYMAGIYEDDVMQFLGHEEGRARFTADPNQPVVYDYIIKDHLGNVRMLLTEEQKVDKYPVASLETSKLSTEQAYYNINTNQIAIGSSVTGLPTYTNDNGIGNNPSDPTFETSNSQKLYFLNSNNAKTGLGITLKVMAGDKIDIFGKSYYFQNNTGGSTANSAIALLEILNGFLGTPGGTVISSAHEAVTATELSCLSGTSSGINSLLSNQTTDNNQYAQKPKAYINYILFDEQFKTVGSGFSAVGTNSTLKDHHNDLQNIEVPKNGYVYIYCSNESPVNVYFDNLQVVHTRGRIIEETHYYPFGLTMAGISSKAAGFGGSDNNNKFQGQEFASKEFTNGCGLDMYEFKWRMDDPQIGRFWQTDPLANDYVYNSTYAFSENKVTSHIELEGKEARSIKEDETKIVNTPKPFAEPKFPFTKAQLKQISEESKSRESSKSKASKPNTKDNSVKLIGNTSTHTYQSAKSTFSNRNGDELKITHSDGVTAGKEGVLATTNVASEDFKPNSASISIPGNGFNVELGINADNTFNLGASNQGNEVHITFGQGSKGLGSIGGGYSTSSAPGLVSQTQATLTCGPKTASIVIAIIASVLVGTPALAY
jgi:YD repeat-containing protein